MIVRPDVHVQVHRVPAPDAAFAADLIGGNPVGRAAEAAASDAAFDFGTALVGLVSLGAFSAVRIEGEEQ